MKFKTIVKMNNILYNIHVILCVFLFKCKTSIFFRDSYYSRVCLKIKYFHLILTFIISLGKREKIFYRGILILSKKAF